MILELSRQRSLNFIGFVCGSIYAQHIIEHYITVNQQLLEHNSWMRSERKRQPNSGLPEPLSFQSECRKPKPIPLYQCARSAVKKYHKLRGLNKEKLVLQFWRLEVQNQGVSSIVFFFLRTVRENLFHASNQFLIGFLAIFDIPCLIEASF